jgi:hypothetical protein
VNEFLCLLIPFVFLSDSIDFLIEKNVYVGCFSIVCVSLIRQSRKMRLFSALGNEDAWTVRDAACFYLNLVWKNIHLLVFLRLDDHEIRKVMFGSYWSIFDYLYRFRIIWSRRILWVADILIYCCCWRILLVFQIVFKIWSWIWESNPCHQNAEE